MDIFSNPDESNSENDYIQVCPDTFETQFNLVFEGNKESNNIMSESEEEDQKNVIFNPNLPKSNSNPPVSIIDTEPPNPSPFIIYKEEDYIIFRPSKEKKNCKKHDQLLFKVCKVEKLRKECPDEIRKKIKSRFFKALRKYINQILDNLHINKKYEFLPQSFICIITKSKIKEMLDKTLEEIIISFKKDNSEKVKNNCELLVLLKKNMNNIKIKKLYRIFSTRIETLFKEYLKSEEFDKSVTKLKDEGNYSQYIEKYISLANNFVEYFSK